jgi:hypothetical protein
MAPFFNYNYTTISLPDPDVAHKYLLSYMCLMYADAVRSIFLPVPDVWLKKRAPYLYQCMMYERPILLTGPVCHRAVVVFEPSCPHFTGGN